MEPTFRQSMNWLHTWAGVVLGGLLFAVFWSGSLVVFDKEIDRWMAPMTRLSVADAQVQIDELLPSLTEAATSNAPFWNVVLPNEREPLVRTYYRERGALHARNFNPTTGAELPESGTWAGTQFLYPFHYSLHIHFAEIGTWLVGLAGMTMLVMCVTGLVIHRKIFAEFFTFRPRKKSRRVLLDLHNVAGILGLPFHFVIALSGLIIFATTYFPSGLQANYQNAQAYSADAFDSYERQASGKPGGPIASLDTMAVKARPMWGGASPSYLQVRHPGDSAAYVIMGRSGEDRITAIDDTTWFDAASGHLLHRSIPAKPVMTAQRFISGLHLIQFHHWTLRWLYFAMGLSGCVLIATGYLFWLESRRKKHAQLGLAGVRVVEGLAIGSVTGIIIATLTFFVVNRLLPRGITFAGIERAALEVWAFYLVWLATFAHAWARPRCAWVEQCRVVALFAVAAVLLNWITTGDHLIRSLTHRHLWPIAGMDLLLIAGAGAAALASHRLDRRAAEPPARSARSIPDTEPQLAE